MRHASTHWWLAASFALGLGACSARPHAAPLPAPAPASVSFDPVTEDPPGTDLAHPESLAPVAIMSGGARMNGLVYVARGAGPHPTVVLLPGHAGSERNLDLAQVLRRAGWNVLFFHYRGSWGSGGTYSVRHQIEDVHAALAFARSAEAVRLRSDTGRVAVIGHSRGAFLALLAAAEDPRVACVGAIAPGNLGARARELRGDTAAARAWAHATMVGEVPLQAEPDDTALTDLLTHAERYDLLDHVRELAQRPVLFVAGTRDRASPPAEVTEPLAAALRAAGGAHVTTVILDTDHLFSDRRIALARAVLSWLRAECTA